nr:hypothetical protein GCM10025699_07430 [Microbacterium flavescens]
MCNHAQSGGDGSILDMTAERLDAFWSANARSSLLLTQAFAALHRLEAPAADPVSARDAPSRSPSRSDASSG